VLSKLMFITNDWLVHFYPGIGGMLLASLTGLMQGLRYLMTQRKLWLHIICPGTIDTLGFVLI